MKKRRFKTIEKSDKNNQREYEPPKIVRKNKMTFPIDIIESTGKGQVCKQCSSCHNCK